MKQAWLKSACSHLLWLGVLMVPIHLAGAPVIQLYVATNGNDAWSGSLAEPNAARTDGPIGSLTGARNTLRAKRTGGAMTLGPVSVKIRGGIYPLASPLVFEPQDSGVPKAPVI